MRMQVTFRGGAQIEVDVDRFEVGRNKLTGEVQSLTWETPADWTSKLNTIADLSEIVAIVAIEERAGRTGLPASTDEVAPPAGDEINN